MPIYDYQCTSCGHKAEVMRKVSDALSIEACPACAKQTFAKQVSAPSFQLTGNGWYATDFKGGSSTKPALPASEPVANTASATCGTGCACH